MPDADSHYNEALDIVNRYYLSVVDRMAHEVVEREDSILEGGYGWTEIEDRYANRLFNIGQIYGNISKFASADDDDAITLPPPGVDASRVRVAEARCSPDATRETIERWLTEHADVYLWKLVVHPISDDEASCLFLYTN